MFWVSKYLGILQYVDQTFVIWGSFSMKILNRSMEILLADKLWDKI